VTTITTTKDGKEIITKSEGCFIEEIAEENLRQAEKNV